MSLNVALKHRIYKYLVDFPFQTPTPLTERMLATTDRAAQCAMCEACLREWWPDDPTTVNAFMTDIRALLADDQLQVIGI